MYNYIMNMRKIIVVTYCDAMSLIVIFFILNSSRIYLNLVIHVDIIQEFLLYTKFELCYNRENSCVF